MPADQSHLLFCTAVHVRQRLSVLTILMSKSQIQLEQTRFLGAEAFVKFLLLIARHGQRQEQCSILISLMYLIVQERHSTTLSTVLQCSNGLADIQG